MHIVPRGAAINATYTIKALGKFMEHFKKKRPAMAQQQWLFQWDNPPVQTTASMKEWMAAKGIQLLEHLPYSLDLAPADFFLFRMWREAFADITFDQESLKNTWEGVTRISSPKTSPWPCSGGLSRPISAFRLAATSPINL
jgi:hypothetical protein